MPSNRHGRVLFLVTRRNAATPVFRNGPPPQVLQVEVDGKYLIQFGQTALYNNRAVTVVVCVLVGEYYCSDRQPDVSRDSNVQHVTECAVVCDVLVSGRRERKHRHANGK